MVARHIGIPISSPSAARVEIRPVGRGDLLEASRGLTARDSELLSYLGEHRVLTALQAARLLFGSYSRARSRLAALHNRSVLARFRHDIWPGTEPWRYTLGPVGAVVHAAATGARLPRASDVTEKVLRLAHSPQTDHLLGVNDIFVTLAAYARVHEDCRLSRWTAEKTVADACSGLVRPDAYAEWMQDGTSVRFFFEHDRGSEPLKTLVDKIHKYAALADHSRVRRPVLFRLPTTAREHHLHHALRKRWPSGPPVSVAITSAEQLVTPGNEVTPASPCAADAVWLAVGGGGQRRRLIDLQSPQSGADPLLDAMPHAA